MWGCIRFFPLHMSINPSCAFSKISSFTCQWQISFLMSMTLNAPNICVHVSLLCSHCRILLSMTLNKQIGIYTVSSWPLVQWGSCWFCLWHHDKANAAIVSHAECKQGSQCQHTVRAQRLEVRSKRNAAFGRYRESSMAQLGQEWPPQHQLQLCCFTRSRLTHDISTPIRNPIQHLRTWAIAAKHQIANTFKNCQHWQWGGSVFSIKNMMSLSENLRPGVWWLWVAIFDSFLWHCQWHCQWPVIGVLLCRASSQMDRASSKALQWLSPLSLNVIGIVNRGAA